MYKYLIALLCLPLAALSQSLDVGASVPSLHFSNVMHYDRPILSLQDLKGKVVLLDFFATWCGSCIRELPKLKKLREKSAGRLEVILVTMEPSAKVTALEKQNKIVREAGLPVICEDSILNRLFPNRLLPHTVWLGTDGRVKAITEASQVTAINLERLQRSNAVDLPVKRDVIDFDRGRSILDNVKVPVLFQSFFTAGIQGIPNGATKTDDSLQKTRRASFFNQSFFGLLSNAISQAPSSRWRILSKNTALTSNDQFCYEYTTPLHWTRSQAKKRMLADICAYFDIELSSDTVIIPCLALVRLPGSEPQPSKGGKGESNLFEAEAADRWMVNLPLSHLVNALNRFDPQHRLPVVLDETGWVQKTDLHLALPDLHELDKLNGQLKNYGLQLVPKERPVAVLTITDREQTIN